MHAALPSSLNILAIGQAGRLQFEAILLAASLRYTNPTLKAQLYIADPQPCDRWNSDPRIANGAVRGLLEEMGARIVPFETRVFGDSYPNGNKIEGLAALPEGEPFLFLDTDTLITGDLSQVPFDFDRPTASLKRENTWPKPELYGPGYSGLWQSLYDKFGLDFASSLDLGQPDEYWQRYLYFNAGFFYYRCPRVFGQRYLEYATAIRDDPPEALCCQEMTPWLDQIALPLVIHSLGGGRVPAVSDLMDGDVTCHYRLLPMLYAREADPVVEILESSTAHNRIKKVLKIYEPALRMIYQKRGHKVRALFDRENLPRKERAMRNRIKREGFWMR